MSHPQNAPHWLLFRGLLREAGHWGSFLDQFRQAFPGSRVETLDLPGCGVHHDMPVPSNVPEIVDWLRARRRQASGPAVQPVSLFGLSLGGMVALDWTARYPEEVAGAVVVASSAAGLGPWLGRCRPAGMVALARAALTRAGEARERVVFRLTSRRPELIGSTVPMWAALARERPVRAASAARLLLAASRFRLPAVERWRPTLVLAGGGDRLVDPRCSRALAAAIGAPLQEHPEAGHDLPLDAPGWVLERVAAWQAGRL